MATAPTFVAEQETALNGTTPKSVGASLSALNGDILVEVAGKEASNTSDLSTPTGGTSVTRTQRASEDGNSGTTAEAKAWTAPVTSDQTFTPSFSISTGSLKFAGTALLFRASDGVGNAASTNNGTGSGGPSLSITTTQDNSAIVVVVADWNAADGASRTWRTVNSITPTAANGYERTYLRDSAAVTYYCAYYPDAGAAGAKTVGLSAPSTQRYVICAVEIKGTTASGAISGATTLTFSQTGDLKGSGALAGTSALAFTPTGNLIGQAPISGTTSITFTPTATGTATAAAEGTTSLTFTPSGTLAGSGALAGTAALAFTPSATLTGDGVLAGTAALTFSPSATLAGGGALAGTTALAFTPSATLTGDGALEGATSLTFTLTGTLDLPPGEMSGATDLTFAPSGTLTGDGALEGTAALAFDATGSLTGTAGSVAPAAAGGGVGWNLSFVPDPNARRRRAKVKDEEELRRSLETAILGIKDAPPAMPEVRQAARIIAPYREGSRVDVTAMLEQAKLAQRVIDLYARIVEAQAEYEQDEEEVAMLLLAA